MAKDKTKNVEINGVNYQMSRFTPYVGTHMLMKLIGAVARHMSEQQALGGVAQESVAPEKTGEEMARAICSGAFLAGLDRDLHNEIQKECLLKCARIEDSGLPMPLMSASGPLPEVADDFGLIIRLMIETLTFNYTDFFEQGGLKALGMG